MLNGALFSGPFGNAGAIGSMPLPAPYSQATEDADRTCVQLIHCASRYLVDEQIRKAGFDPDLVLPLSGKEPCGALPPEVEGILDTWLEKVGASMAYAATAAISVIDFEGIVIDGALPKKTVARLTAIVASAIAAPA